MERLTKRGYKKQALLIGTSCSYGYISYDCKLKEGNELLKSALDKLAGYEDLEEQGRLLKLPCKVGDKIFLDFAGFGKDIDKFTVKDFHLDCFKDGEAILFCDYESNNRTLSGQIDVMEFGKTVFLTREEAKSRLEELRGGENE